MINHRGNQIFHGYDHRSSLYDVYYPSEDARFPLIIFCHGFKGFKDWGTFPIICKKLVEAGFLVLSFNFSHNGIGLNNPTEFSDLAAFAENNYQKEQADIRAILDLLGEDEQIREKADLSDISIIGHSRGGSMAILAAIKDERIKRVISWAAVADLKARLPEKEVLEKWKSKGVRHILNGRTGQQMPMNYQFVKCLLEDPEEFDIKQQLGKMEKPMLIIHGDDDEAVDLDHAQRLKEWYHNAKLEVIKGTGHTFGGKHPFTEDTLPLASQILLEKSVAFIRSN